MSSIWAELQRRNVVRVAIAYAIAAWVLIQIAETTFPILRLPEWSLTLVTVLLLIGFPVAFSLGGTAVLFTFIGSDLLPWLRWEASSRGDAGIIGLSDSVYRKRICGTLLNFHCGFGSAPRFGSVPSSSAMISTSVSARRLLRPQRTTSWSSATKRLILLIQNSDPFL